MPGSGERSARLLVAVAFTLSAGCNGNDDPGGARSGVDGGRADGGASSRKCPGPGYATNPAPSEFTHLSAEVVDTAGSPVPDLRAQACGTNLCLNGTTDSTGAVTIDKQATLYEPAFKYGDGRGYAKLALALTGAGPVQVDLGKQVTLAFDPPSEGAPLTAGTTATSRGVTLTLPADLVPVTPDPFDFDTADLKKFRAATFPGTALPAAVDPSLGLELVIALTPVGATLCPAAKLSVPNDAAWPAGARVEFFLHGVEIEEEWAPYGGWAKISDGTVSADGSAVETADGAGLPVLSVVGVRLAR